MRPSSRNTRWRWQTMIDEKDQQWLNGDQSCYFNRLMDVGSPVEANDAATKAYVDFIVGDLDMSISTILTDILNKLSVDPSTATNQLLLLRPGAKGFTFSQSFTRPNTVTPYTAGDAISDSESSPTILSQDLAGFGVTAGHHLLITNVRVILSIKNTTAAVDVWISNKSFSATNDNSELSIDDTTAINGGHVISCPNSKSTALNTILESDPGQWKMKMDADSILRVAVQASSGFTPSALAVYTVIIDGIIL